MSRRGRASGPAISLFSFQDIVTSVTAILILIVLILTLELVSRSRDRGVSSEHRQVAAQLRASLKRLREHAEALRNTVAENRRQSMERAGFSPVETARRIEAAERALRASEAEMRELAEKQLDSRAELRAAERELVDTGKRHGDAVEERAIEIENSNDGEERRQESQRQKQANPAGAGTLVFNPDPDSRRRPSLVELSADGVVVLPAGGAEARRFGWGVLGPRQAFLDWLDGVDKQRHYVVIILRPSGLPRYDEVREAVRGRGIDVGVELVGEDMQVVFADGRES